MAFSFHNLNLLPGLALLKNKTEIDHPMSHIFIRHKLEQIMDMSDSGLHQQYIKHGVVNKKKIFKI